jgi:choline dehydrogenase-like flavoprotein
MEANFDKKTIFLSNKLRNSIAQMHTDARKIENNTLIEGDLCIVGAGASGISLAMEWANAKRKVILLEGGGFEYDDKVQELYAGKLTGQPYFPLKAIRLHYFGGTTGHWAGFCAPFDEIDFKKREWVPHSGWPITLKDLDPYYKRANPILDLGPSEWNADYWIQKYPEFKPLPMNEKILWNKIWQFSPPTRFGIKYREPIVKSRNIHLYTYANVTEIRTNENISAVTEVIAKNYAGITCRVRAKYFAIACCSVQNARLLLASNQQAPKGLGNDHDLVGRFFMEHLEMKSAELWLKDPDPLAFYSWAWGKAHPRAEIAVSEEQQTLHKILNGTASFVPLSQGRQMRPFIELYKNDKDKTNLGMISDTSKHFESVSPKDKSYLLRTRIEQSPNPNSRVTISAEKDSLDMPRASLNWDLTPLEKRSMRKHYELLGQEMGRASKGRIRLMDYLRDENDYTWPASTGGGWHHMGTTRMSEDPKHGVVNAQCQVHGIQNLFMAGSSCFVTAAAPNPTLTLVALTLRLSDHIKERMARQG